MANNPSYDRPPRYEETEEYRLKKEFQDQLDRSAKETQEQINRMGEKRPHPNPPTNAGLNPPYTERAAAAIFEAEKRKHLEDRIRENIRASTDYFHKAALGETVTLGNGAKQARILGRFDLIPFEVWQNVAMVLEMGAAKYGVDNWRGIPYEDHVNHLMYHAGKSLTNDTSEDHLIHAICRAMFAWTVAQKVNSV